MQQAWLAANLHTRCRNCKAGGSNLLRKKKAVVSENPLSLVLLSDGLSVSFKTMASGSCSQPNLFHTFDIIRVTRVRDVGVDDIAFAVQTKKLPEDEQARLVFLVTHNTRSLSLHVITNLPWKPVSPEKPIDIVAGYQRLSNSMGWQNRNYTLPMNDKQESLATIAGLHKAMKYLIGILFRPRNGPRQKAPYNV